MQGGCNLKRQEIRITHSVPTLINTVLTIPQVSEMQAVASSKAVVVAQAKADCEELLVAIVQVRAYCRA